MLENLSHYNVSDVCWTHECLKASRETRRELNPQERLRQMVLVLDSSLAENSEFMESLVGELEEMGVEHRVGVGGAPGGVTWKRKARERNVTENVQVS